MFLVFGPDQRWEVGRGDKRHCVSWGKICIQRNGREREEERKEDRGRGSREWRGRELGRERKRDTSIASLFSIIVFLKFSLW